MTHINFPASVIEKAAEKIREEGAASAAWFAKSLYDNAVSKSMAKAALTAAFEEMERIGMAVAADGWIQDESNLMMAKENSHEPPNNYPGYISCLIIRLDQN